MTQNYKRFVSNKDIKETKCNRGLHWKGLWATFAHHGQVLDAFIPLKKTKEGKQFGLVRFSNRVDAQRAISRFNGLVLYRFRILVSLARFNVRDKFWKKVSPKVHDEDKGNCFKQIKSYCFMEEPSDLEKSHFLEVEGELSTGKSKSEFSPEVDFLNVGFNPKADINERFLWDIVGLEGAGGVSGVVEHDYSPCVGKVNYFNFNRHVFQELHVESAALIHSCGGMASVQLPSEFREPLLADVATGASVRTLYVPNSRASAKCWKIVGR
ncbi:hypothetical protein GQ457_05G032850 [Hibiscus cannabinus]